MTHLHSPQLIARARLPRWLLPDQWPVRDGSPALADITVDAGRIGTIQPHQPAALSTSDAVSHWDLAGCLVLPGLVDAHTHLDKAFTLSRMGVVKPGLLGAIEAMLADRASWTTQDIHTRASRAMQWAWESGAVQVRTHCDWWEPDAIPKAWQVLRELGDEWAGRITLERVSLIPLHLYEDRDAAFRLAGLIARSGPGARLGGFVHTTNWSPQALRHLFEAAKAHDLDVDLHVDEELNPEAKGLATTAFLLRELQFEGRVVCGHTCALSAQDEPVALATLDAVSRAPITLVTLPVTNLLLQDAQTGRTPRRRGITLIKEARARGIPVLIASDNVQDPFCAVGSFDPLDALNLGVAAAQLQPAFDVWSESLCRADWLARGPAVLPMQKGTSADLVVFTQADPWGFPSRTHSRIVLRQGAVRQGDVPRAWLPLAHNLAREAQ